MLNLILASLIGYCLSGLLTTLYKDKCSTMAWSVVKQYHIEHRDVKQSLNNVDKVWNVLPYIRPVMFTATFLTSYGILVHFFGW